MRGIGGAIPVAIRQLPRKRHLKGVVLRWRLHERRQLSVSLTDLQLEIKNFHHLGSFRAGGDWFPFTELQIDVHHVISCVHYLFSWLLISEVTLW